MFSGMNARATTSSLLSNPILKGSYLNYLLITSIFHYYFQLSHSTRKRVSKRMKSGNLEKLEHLDLSKVCIFAGYCAKMTISDIEYLKILRSQGYVVIYINNGKIRDDDKKFLNIHDCIYFERINLGRDVGAYQDGYLFLKENNLLEKVKFLMFTNDSLQFIPGSYSDRLFKSIENFEKSTYEAYYITKSFTPLPHFQSFLMILTPHIFMSSNYSKFMKNYIPLNNRRHSIMNFEIKICTKVLNKYTNVFIENTVAKLVEQEELSDRQASLKKASYKVTRPDLEQDKLQSHPFYDVNEQEDSFLGELENGNLSHNCAFLLTRFLNFPYFKKDLCLQSSYSIAVTVSQYRKNLELSINPKNEENNQLIKSLITEFENMLYHRGTKDSYRLRIREAIQKGIF